MYRSEKEGFLTMISRHQRFVFCISDQQKRYTQLQEYKPIAKVFRCYAPSCHDRRQLHNNPHYYLSSCDKNAYNLLHPIPFGDLYAKLNTMEFIDPKLDAYVCEHTQNEPEILKELNRRTHLEVLSPRMLSGHFQGRVLSMLSHMIKPRRVLEIGTYTGYSALCFAEGLTEDGKVITIDVNEELEDLVREYITKSGNEKKIEYLIGDAAHFIPALNEAWDIVFIDADKKSYCNYFNLVIDKVKKGGYIIADNVLWSGKVLEEYESLDRETKIIMDYNEMIQNDPRVENVLLPIRDGLMIARKL
jgi:caffeoyl-CoA O-methyltransferase